MGEPAVMEALRRIRDARVRLHPIAGYMSDENPSKLAAVALEQPYSDEDRERVAEALARWDGAQVSTGSPPYVIYRGVEPISEHETRREALDALRQQRADAAIRAFLNLEGEPRG